MSDEDMEGRQRRALRRAFIAGAHWGAKEAQFGRESVEHEASRYAPNTRKYRVERDPFGLTEPNGRPVCWRAVEGLESGEHRVRPCTPHGEPMSSLVPFVEIESQRAALFASLLSNPFIEEEKGGA